MQDKKALRKAFLKQRGELTARIQIEERIAELLLQSELYRQADMVLCYAASGSEISVTRVAEAALLQGKMVCFPRCTDRKGHMQFCRVDMLSQLIPGMYGISEPEERCAVQTEFAANTLCLVPGLAFDHNGYRLGYGKGYYDRFAAAFCGILTGICPEDLFLSEQTWEYDRYDMAVRYIVTERGMCCIHREEV